MSIINVEAVQNTQSIPVKTEAITPRSINLALAEKASLIAEDANSPDRIKAIQDMHFYLRMAAEPSTDEMREQIREEAEAEHVRRLGRTTIQKITDVFSAR